jgi:hypothetical protein
VYASVGLLLILAVAGLSGGFGGGISTDLSVAFSVLLMVVAVWIILHPKSYISVDKTDSIFRSYVFGFVSHEIPISSITDIGTTGSFLGALKIITITYRKSNGTEKTVRVGSKQTYNKVSLLKVLHYLVEINPKLHIPSELEN